jgi:hypothetical protein
VVYRRYFQIINDSFSFINVLLKFINESHHFINEKHNLSTKSLICVARISKIKVAYQHLEGEKVISPLPKCFQSYYRRCIGVNPQLLSRMFKDPFVPYTQQDLLHGESNQTHCHTKILPSLNCLQVPLLKERQ